jgi:hypothetical protein
MSETERVGFPRWASIRYQIPARGPAPPIEIHHHHGAPEGRKRIEQHLGRRLDWGDAGERQWKEHGGCLIVGTEGMLKSTEHNSSFTLLPEDQVQGLPGSAEDPAPFRKPRARVHGGLPGRPPTMSNFDYAGPLMEFLLLANVATLFRRNPGVSTRWPARSPTTDGANAALSRQYRNGWTL